VGPGLGRSEACSLAGRLAGADVPGNWAMVRVDVAVHAGLTVSLKRLFVKALSFTWLCSLEEARAAKGISTMTSTLISHSMIFQLETCNERLLLNPIVASSDFVKKGL
jgi:hypothetical protein